MAYRTWGRVLLAAFGVGLLAGAGQLGFAYGLGVVRFSRDFDGVTGEWAAHLAWVAWFAMLAAVAGALAGEFTASRAGYRAGAAARVAYAIAGGVGAAAVAPLAMLPARAADVPGADAVVIAGLSGALGALGGVLAAMLVLLHRVAGLNLAAVTVGIWMLALLSVAPSLGPEDPLPEVRLGVLDATFLGAGFAQRLAVVCMPALALAAGAAIGALGRWRGMPMLPVAASGVIGPGLLALAYLIAGPGDGGDRYQTAPYWGSIIAVAAGALGSVLASVARGLTAGSASAGEPPFDAAGGVHDGEGGGGPRPGDHTAEIFPGYAGPRGPASSEHSGTGSFDRPREESGTPGSSAVSTFDHPGSGSPAGGSAGRSGDSRSGGGRRRQRDSARASSDILSGTPLDPSVPASGGTDKPGRSGGDDWRTDQTSTFSPTSSGSPTSPAGPPAQREAGQRDSARPRDEMPDWRLAPPAWTPPPGGPAPTPGQRLGGRPSNGARGDREPAAWTPPPQTAPAPPSPPPAPIAPPVVPAAAAPAAPPQRPAEPEPAPRKRGLFRRNKGRDDNPSETVVVTPQGQQQERTDEKPEPVRAQSLRSALSEAEAEAESAADAPAREREGRSGRRGESRPDLRVVEKAPDRPADDRTENDDAGEEGARESRRRWGRRGGNERRDTDRRDSDRRDTDAASDETRADLSVVKPPADAPRDDATPEPEPSRGRGRGRNKPEKPMRPRDEEYVDWVSGLSAPVPDEEPRRRDDSPRRSLRSTTQQD